MENEITVMKTTKYVLNLLKLKKTMIKDEEFRYVSYSNILQDLIIADFEKRGIDWKEEIKKID